MIKIKYYCVKFAEPMKSINHLRQKFIRNQGKANEDMMQKTRTILEDFYRPWNKMLCTFMQQNKYVCGW